eukprot:gene8477-7754_t
MAAWFEWPDEFAAVEDLELVLSCAMCKEAWSAPVMLPGCGHTFCSLCIRKWLEQSQTCPQCKAAASASGLIPNRAVEEFTTQFGKARPFLVELATNPAPANPPPGTAPPGPADG